LVVSVTFSSRVRANLLTYPSRTNSALLSALFGFERRNASGTFDLSSEVTVVMPTAFTISSSDNKVVTFTVTLQSGYSTLPQGDWYVVLKNGFESRSYDTSVVQDIKVSVDTVPPVLTSITPVNSGTQGASFAVRVNFDSTIQTTGDVSGCLSQENAPTTPVISSISFTSTSTNYIEYQVTMDPAAEFTGTINFQFSSSCPVTDDAGNTFVSNVVGNSAVVDAKPPRVSQITLNNIVGGQVKCDLSFSITFDEVLAATATPTAQVRVNYNGESYDTYDVTPSTSLTATYDYTVSSSDICQPGGNPAAANSLTISILGTDQSEYVSISSCISYYSTH
jgi:hypothetical protein